MYQNLSLKQEQISANRVRKVNWLPRETGWRSLKVSWADGCPPSAFLQLTVCVSLLQISPFTPSSAAAAVLYRPGMMWDESRTTCEWNRWWRDVHPAGPPHALFYCPSETTRYELWRSYMQGCLVFQQKYLNILKTKMTQELTSCFQRNFVKFMLKMRKKDLCKWGLKTNLVFPFELDEFSDFAKNASKILLDFSETKI